MIKIEIKSVFGTVLFTYEKENNTIKETLLEALKNNADLSGVNLSGVNLSGADLSGADLSGADLSGADLSGVNLSGVNLSGADLSYADLSGANIRYADLRYADLSYAKNTEISYLPMFCKWSHSIKGNKIQIGCKEKTIKEWDSFFASEEEYETNRNTEEFKQIEAVYNAYKAYLQTLNE